MGLQALTATARTLPPRVARREAPGLQAEHARGAKGAHASPPQPCHCPPVALRRVPAAAQPKFKPVSLEGGPVIKETSRRNTGLETKKPYAWGPLGGYY